MKVYLAGKITQSAWREDIVDGLAEFTADLNKGYNLIDDFDWPEMERAIFGKLDYVGPYYFAHSDEVHASAFHNSHRYFDSEPNVVRLCLEAVARADVVFGWLTGPDLYGTYAELGAARALGKRVFVTGPSYEPAQWFIRDLSEFEIDATSIMEAYGDGLHYRSPLAREAFYYACSRAGLLCESPIESQFFEEYEWMERGSLIPILSQHPVGRFRLDFAIPWLKLAVELDGHEFHKTKEQRGRDAKRDRLLGKQGWHVMRFTGSEVYRDAEGCAREVLEEARRRQDSAWTLEELERRAQASNQADEVSP